MDRREFATLIGAGVLFPADFLKARTGLEGLENDDHTQYYPIYYMWSGSTEVYQLWSPGIIMGCLEVILASAPAVCGCMILMPVHIV